MKKALVILSGGQDSTTCLFWAKEHYDEVHAITFDYGQRHRLELEAARIVANMAHVKSHEVLYIPSVLKSTSPLTSGANLEQYENAEQMEAVIGDRIELTFVPMRNMLFFTIGVNRAVELGCSALVTGICQEDNANYPDCTERFRAHFEMTANTALGNSLTIPINFDHYLKLEAPLMYLSKAETCKLAFNMTRHSNKPSAWDALAYTHTSYDGTYPPTDMNHANVLRAKGFEDADLQDPLVIRAWREGLMELPTTNNYNQCHFEK